MVAALSKRTHAASTAIAAAIALVTAILGFVFLARPNLEPTTTNAVRITNIVVEPRVTRGEYLRHPAVRGSLDKSTLAPWLARPDLLQVAGTGIDFQFETRGYVGRSLQTRWTLFNGETNERLAESEALDPFQATPIRVEKRETDMGTWEIWVDTSRFDAPSYFVRIEFYQHSPGSVSRITFADSPKFLPPPR